MKSLETEIEIAASPQTVWSILDDLRRYPEWNSLVPKLAGTTTVGQVVTGELVQPNMPVIPLAPTLTRIVGGRELRWLTVVPGDQGFSAEHYFLLHPTGGGGTRLVHNENFDGPAIGQMWSAIDANGRPAYNQMNRDLKARAERFVAAEVKLHPAADGDHSSGRSEQRSGFTLRCKCSEAPVEVKIDGPAYHNHLCGCSKCWKPADALFAQIAVAAADTSHIVANGNELEVVDDRSPIRRSACRRCGVHMLGQVDDPDHHFFGLVFFHPELSDSGHLGLPEFAGFVSSLIDSLECPSQMQAIRRRLSELSIPSYDAFSPELMDIIAWHGVKLRRKKAAR